MKTKTEIVNAWLTPHEKARLDRAVAHAGNTRSGLIRLAILRHVALAELEMVAAGAIGLDPVEPDAVQAVIP